MSDILTLPEANEAAAAKVAPVRITKSGTVIKLLSRNRGTTLAEVMMATSWQPHSSRAFLTGLRKKGLELLKETRRDGETSYRIDR